MLKRLWLLVGILVLPILVYGLYNVITEWFVRDWVEPTVGLPADTAAASTSPRAVWASLLDPIIGSKHRILAIHYGEAQVYEEYGVIGSSRRRYDPGAHGAVVNIGFLDPNGHVSLLFDRPAYIRSYDFPDAPEDSTQKWVFFEVALVDTDRDNQLGSADELALYTTDLTGAGLRRVSPDSIEYKNYKWPDPAGVVLITGLTRPRSPEETEDSRRQQRFVVFDARSGVQKAAGALDSAVARAGSILRR